MTRALLPLLLATACIPPGDRPDGTSEPDTGGPSEPHDPPSCTSGIQGSPLPAQGQTGVSPRTAFAVSFLVDERDGATFQITRARSTEPITRFRPTWSEDGEEVWFRSTPLEPDTDHVLTIDYGRHCNPARHVEVPFRTADLDTEADAHTLADTVWALDLSEARVLQPASLDPLLSSLFHGLDPLILRFSDAREDGEALALTIGSGTDADGEIRQDTCAATVTLDEPVYVEDGWFSVDLPAAVPLPTASLTFDAVQLRLDGGIAPDGDTLLGLHARVMVDVEDFADAVDEEDIPSDEPLAVCDLVQTFTGGGVSCGPCPDGGETCVALILTDAEAHRLDGALLDRPASVVAADARCQGAPARSPEPPLP